ncbi:hypothetical protein PFISCL1PPCAC_24211, partial [Pristionchus fissidentatus]
MRVLVALLLLNCIPASYAEGKLVFVQTLWRHGDRIPKETYPTDPYQKEYWGLPWGEITQDGLQHHFQQGENLRSLLIDSGFLSGNYNREEVVVRSADTPRCIQSALSNMAGFYADSPAAISSNLPNWPTGWTPVPVHSEPKKEDRQLQPGISCPKADSLVAERQNTRKFQDFLASNWNLYALLMQFGGQDSVEITFDTLKDWFSTLRVEKEQFALLLPSWITDDVYNQLKQAFLAGHDFVDGAAGFDLPQDDELIKLRGGYLLHEWRSNLKDASTKEGGIKYHAYSAHDHTVTALLHTLGAKDAVVGNDIPHYTATIVNELWMKDGQYYVKFLYIDDFSSTPRVITSLLDPCPNDSDLCPLEQFLDKSDKFSTKKDT